MWTSMPCCTPALLHARRLYEQRPAQSLRLCGIDPHVPECTFLGLSLTPRCIESVFLSIEHKKGLYLDRHV